MLQYNLAMHYPVEESLSDWASGCVNGCWLVSHYRTSAYVTGSPSSELEWQTESNCRGMAGREAVKVLLPRYGMPRNLEIPGIRWWWSKKGNLMPVILNMPSTGPCSSMYPSCLWGGGGGGYRNTTDMCISGRVAKGQKPSGKVMPWNLGNFA